MFHDSKPTTSAKILPDSPAAKARLQPGDEILLVDGDTPILTADFSWTLHHLRDQDQLPLLITRKGILRPVTLILPNNWRLKSDISRRVGTWPMRARIGGGMKLESLSDKDRYRLKIRKDQLTLRAGFLKSDILIEVDGLKENLTESQLFGTLLKRHPQPTKLDCQIIRKGKTINLKFPIQ
ncbi:MAG: PDZ domain-containing protein [Akkermansiaceae bacterium]|nr:PDZ domain-containing protein [Akkermansiaceae bacterium]